MPDQPLNILNNPDARRAFTMHDRTWQHNRYVYPVVSRRSKGISIGVNLNPDKVCNFDCIYCSVDRKQPGAFKEVDLPILRDELTHMLHLAAAGDIFRFDPFDRIPAQLRRINDIAFSGDGEPTSCPNFFEACKLAANCLEQTHPAPPEPVKLVLITNATLFHRPAVRETLTFLDHHHGEIWAKLDAGTPAYYDLVDRSPVPFARVLENVRWCCTTRPTVIQSLFMRVHGNPPPPQEIAAYTTRLKEITTAGGQIKLVQIYTVARATTESYATPLPLPELESIAEKLRNDVPGVLVEVYP